MNYDKMAEIAYTLSSHCTAIDFPKPAIVTDESIISVYEAAHRISPRAEMAYVFETNEVLIRPTVGKAFE